MDKNKAIINYLLTCDGIKNSALYYNFATLKKGTQEFITLTQDKNIEKPFVDGSVQKRYSLTIISYLTINANPLVVTQQGKLNETKMSQNLTDMATVQALIDWITEQNDNHIFPNFGDKIIVDSISTTTSNPVLDMIDTTQTPMVAKYRVTVQVDYVDYTKAIY